MTHENLKIAYWQWRTNGEESVKGTDLYFTWDCGEASAQEDFADFLGTDISFEDMLSLENSYLTADDIRTLFRGEEDNQELISNILNYYKHDAYIDEQGNVWHSSTPGCYTQADDEALITLYYKLD